MARALRGTQGSVPQLAHRPPLAPAAPGWPVGVGRPRVLPGSEVQLPTRGSERLYLRPDQDTPSGGLTVSRQPVPTLGSAQASHGLPRLFPAPSSTLWAPQTSLFPLLLPLQRRSLEIKDSYRGACPESCLCWRDTLLLKPCTRSGFRASGSWLDSGVSGSVGLWS